MRPLVLRLSFVMCAACGSVKTGQLPDAPPSGDAAQIDAPPTAGPVHVTVLDPSGSGAAAVGAKVVFINPDGTLVKQVATDTAGKADAVVMVGASVTSVALAGLSYQIQTVLGVKPGDDLVLGAKSSDSTTVGTMTISFPAFSGAAFYLVSGPCGLNSVTPPAGAAPAPVTLTFYTYCKLDPMEIVVAAENNNGDVLGSTHKTGVAYANAGDVAMPAYDSARNFTSSYTNINPIIASMSLQRAVPDGFGVSTFASLQSPAATQPIMTVGPSGTTARIDTTVRNTTGSAQHVRQLLAGTAASYGLDVGATLLPWLLQPSFDAATDKLVVPTDTTGTSTAKPDLFRISASYRRTDANQMTTSYNWVVFAADAADVTLPTLPPEVGNIAPAASDVITVTDFAFDVDTVAGYDAVRNDLNAAFQLYLGSRYPATTVRTTQSPLLR